MTYSYYGIVLSSVNGWNAVACNDVHESLKHNALQKKKEKEIAEWCIQYVQSIQFKNHVTLNNFIFRNITICDKLGKKQGVTSELGRQWGWDQSDSHRGSHRYYSFS